MLKIVLDTNVMISAALALKFHRHDSPSRVLFTTIFEEGMQAIASQRMLYELADRLTLPKLGLDPQFVLAFFELYVSVVDIVDIRGLDMGCRDDDDDMFIEAAVNGRVDVLVTRDRDLGAALVRYDLAKRGCKVVDVSECLDLIRGRAT